MQVKKHIGYAPESGFLFDALTGKEFLGMVIDLKKLDHAASYPRTLELAEMLGIRSVLEDAIGAYSKGMRKKVSIVSALVGDPDVVILDEPVDGLDQPAVAALTDLLRGRGRKMTTTILCSHVLDVVERVCGRVCVLSDGALVA